MLGLIGRPLGGSLSASWFGGRGYDYRNFELADIGELPALLALYPELRGFNVTSPYKELIVSYLDELDPVAAAIGAVNCVRVGDGGRLTGYNADAEAFRFEIAEFVDGGMPRALLLGTGGAAKAAAYAFGRLGIEWTTVSRTPAGGRSAYADLTPEIVEAHRLIVNATPLGMGVFAGEKAPIPYAALRGGHMLFDMIYNPDETPFLREGRMRGCRVRNGLGMLHRQAELSLMIWGSIL